MNPFASLKMKPGPVAWCKRCSRKHPRRECDLVVVERVSRKRYNEDGTLRRGGNKVERLIHPPEPKKVRNKVQARKS